MAFSAFHYHPIVERLPLKANPAPPHAPQPQQVECIDTWGKRLIVGTAEGVLLVYEVGSNESGDLGRVSLVDTRKQFSRKPIQQLSVVDETKLLVLTDNIVCVHDLPSFALRTQLVATRGCNLYALNTDTAESDPMRELMLCAAVKRKLIVFRWTGTEFFSTKELAIPDLAKAMAWCGRQLCVGFRREYNLVNSESGDLSELFPTGQAKGASITVLPGRELLLGKDTVSIFIGWDGKPTRTFGLSWSEIPQEIGYSFPYVVAMLPKFVEIRAVETQAMVQTLPLKQARLMTCATKGPLYIAASNNIWLIIPVPLEQQVDELMHQKEYQFALVLAERLNLPTEKKEATLTQIRTRLGFHLFSQGKYEQAMSHFVDLDLDPTEVIGLIPGLLTGRSQSAKLDGPMLTKALVALASYLTHKRRSPTFGDDEQMAQLMDTTLLKAYLKTNVALVGPLLRLRPNYCHVEECEKMLRESNLLMELLALFHTKGLHRKALDLLLEHSQGPLESLHGVDETVRYLQGLGSADADLVLEYSKWVLKTDVKAGLSIFASDESSGAVPVDRVLSHLEDVSNDLVVPYLEHVIHKRGETGAQHHNRLVFEYLERVIELQGGEVVGHAPTLAASVPGLLGQTRQKLLSFLRWSDHYNPEKMFSRFHFTNLFEERAVLLSKIGRHEQALIIIVRKLGQPEAAEEYCEQHYDPAREESRDVYLSLLRVYLQPTSESDPLVDPLGVLSHEGGLVPDETDSTVGPLVGPLLGPAIRLLQAHGSFIDTPKALELLPDATLLSALHPFFAAKLRMLSEQRRNAQVEKSLLNSEHLQVLEGRMRARMRSFVVNEDRVCPVCKRRLGLSVCAFLATGGAVHYSCAVQSGLIGGGQ